MMMTCKSEIQHPDGEKASCSDNVGDDNNRFESGDNTVLGPSNVPSQIHCLEPRSPSLVESQDLNRNAYMQTFFTEALVRSSQKKPRLAEESEPQPSAPPAADNHVKPSSVTTSGLDLLGSLALTKPPAEPPTSPAAKMAPGPLEKTVKEWVALETAAKMKKVERMCVDKVLEWDVLCGRGGKSNHWSGNKRYRQVVSEMKAMYKHQDDKCAKTDLSRAIVDYVCNYGGRFLKKEGSSERYYVLNRAEARKKTSQALRETKESKWTL